MPHAKAADIVVCVHNALDDVRACLESLVRCTTPPYRLIVVDDGSDSPTCDYLAAFADAQSAVLIRNETALGYTRAANIGLRASTAPWTVLLNSDTILTPGWLDRLLACGESDRSIGMVGPLSNTASWQSVPDVFDRHGDWAANPLPAGFGPGCMAERVASGSARLYPRLPFLNGFCLMIRREVIDAIGLLDEETFPYGYGEENDYCLRARGAGYVLALADDTYIFHAQSRSYSNELRRSLVDRMDKAVAAKHGPRILADGAEACRSDRVLEGIRSRVRAGFLRDELIEAGRMRWEGRRVLFLLPVSEPGGGSHVVVQEAAAMARMGVDARIVNLRLFRAKFERWLPDLPVPTIFIETPDMIGRLLPRFDAVIGTVFHTLAWMGDTDDAGGVIRGYYVQDFEPAFFPEGSAAHFTALGSYARYSDLVRFTKTEWNRRMVLDRAGVDCHVVGPTVDLDLYRPRPTGDHPAPNVIRVAAMIRPSTPRRQAGLTMDVMRRLVERQGRRVDVVIFGCDRGDPELLKLRIDFPFRHAGILTRRQLATLLSGADVFVDLSSYQAMGLTALEAMASGAAVIVPREGGADSFVRDGENAMMTDTADPAACLAAVEELVENGALRDGLRRRGVEDACAFLPERAAYRILEQLFDLPGSGEAP